MKIIITCISIIALQFTAMSQSDVRKIRQPLKATNQAKIGYVVSTEEPDFSAIRGTTNQNKEIVITRLPSLKVALTSMNIELNMLGAFTFKRAESLAIPYNCEVFIEDKLTKKLFNLKSSEPYTFNVDEYVADRFVMHVLYRTNPGTLVSSGVIRGYKAQS